MKNTTLLMSIVFALSGIACAQNPVPVPMTVPPLEPTADYFAEPKNLPYDEEILEEKQEDGWKWKEFRYTSLVFDGQPIRIHAVYGVPDTATAQNKVPGILMTHGVFGAIKGPDGRYWGAFSQLVKAGYAVLFFDWYPDDAKNAKPGDPKRYTSFGNIDYFTSETWLRRGQEWKESLHYQVEMAGKRGVSWLLAHPEVDANKIGATGASYGGIFSSMLAGNDARIKAVSPTVYTAGFGRTDAAYNGLPGNWSDAEMAAWSNRFDSKTLLAKRKIPILYQVGSSDSTFSLSRAMETFAAMPEPKFLNIGINKGHDFWGFDQTILFFDTALKGKMSRQAAPIPTLKLEGREAVASMPLKGEAPQKVEIAFAPVYEIDAKLSADKIPASSWKWTLVDASANPEGQFTARFPLPLMHPASNGEKFYDWSDGDTFTPTAPTALPAPADSEGLLRAFARVTDQFGAVNCSPFTSPVAFHDGETAPATPTANALSAPVFLGGAKVKTTPTVTKITSEVAAGQPRATFEADLPEKAVGKSGYVLWNWRKQEPDADLQSDGAPTPTKKILPPFMDTIPKNSFGAANLTGFNAYGGFTAFQINGQDDKLVQNRAWHGSVAPGMGSKDEISVEATDDKEHLLTLVMGAIGVDECLVRVSARYPDGGASVVRYLQSDKADNILQFRAKGKVTLSVQITSQPPRQFNDIVGPSALFLD